MKGGGKGRWLAHGRGLGCALHLPTAWMPKETKHPFGLCTPVCTIAVSRVEKKGPHL